MRKTWAEINLHQFIKNIRILKSIIRNPLLVVVKANAYGHGIVKISQILEKENINMLGVAIPDEAKILRTNGISIPILNMTYVFPDELLELLNLKIDIFAWDISQLNLYNSIAKSANLECRIHIKVDTGMGRLGVFPYKAIDILQYAHKLSNIKVVGFATHLSNADSIDTTQTEKQLKIFSGIAEEAKKIYEDIIIHTANSPASILYPNAKFDMVRLGIISYGISPDSSWIKLPSGIKPILSWKSKVSSIKFFPPNYSIGYGGEYVTKNKTVVAVIPVGYVDGYKRTPKNINTVLIAGKEVSVIGRVCMDQIMVDITLVHENVRIGEECVLLGTQERKCISADDLAKKWNTNSYDVLTGISYRVPRVYN